LLTHGGEKTPMAFAIVDLSPWRCIGAA
jgi:hypothetical protein